MIQTLLLCGALAHHNKGLPHYGYFENYPQVPTEEFIRIDGRWEVGATIFNFQGIESRESSDTPNDVKIYAYIYDLQEDEGYTGPVRMEIVLDDQVVSSFERVEPDQEGVYLSRETLPQSGDYDLVFHFPEGQATLPFYVDLAGDGANWVVLGGLGVALGGLFSLTLVGRKRRLARSASAPAPVEGA
jgi:hypothetical protein